MKKINDFSDLLAIANEIYNEVVVKKNMDYQYEGIDLTSTSIICTSPTIESRLSPEGLDWEINEKCNQPIDVIMTIVLQLGIQQGIDLVSNDPIGYFDKDSIPQLDKTLRVLKMVHNVE